MAEMANPIGLNGIEFLEYTSAQPEALVKLFEQFGFQKMAQHRTKKIQLFRQGDINFIINSEPNSFAEKFQKTHGPSICAMGVRVKDAQHAFQEAVRRGAKPYPEGMVSLKGKKHPAIFGIGDSLIYFIEDYTSQKLYEEDFDFIGAARENFGTAFIRIDHLTNNVAKGELDKWCSWYQDIFGFYEARYFDIKGKQTGLQSKVMKSPCAKIIIPINEPTDGKSQIQEYLEEYKGAGIQHVALLTNDICNSVAEVAKRGVHFLDAPSQTYYEMVPERVPQITEKMDVVQGLSILVDGDQKGYLLQIFTQNQIGPIFFEVIQRKGHDGFGEGNFQALFDSIERDQVRRGYLKA